MSIENDENSAELKRIVEALHSGTRVFIIRGAAGTGKTTLVKRLVPLFHRCGLSVRLMTPTGRAARVLSKRTCFQAETIHSQIFILNDNPVKDDTGAALKWIFPLKRGDDIENIAFIIDESSMVGLSKHDNDRELFQFGSGSLLGDLVEYSGVKVANTSNLLVFIGDHYQLPPVGESCDIPPALDAERLKELTGLQPYVMELSMIHRQIKGSGILEEASKLRSAIKNGDFNRFGLMQHDDVTFEGLDSLAAWKNLDSIDDKILIARTNAQVREYNDMIRGRLGIDRKFPLKGERLLSLRNTIVGDIQLYNGDFLRVTDVTNRTFELDGFYRPKNEEISYHFHYTFMKMSFNFCGEPERGCVNDVWVNITPLLDKTWDEMDRYALIGLYNGVKARMQDTLIPENPG